MLSGPACRAGLSNGAACVNRHEPGVRTDRRAARSSEHWLREAVQIMTDPFPLPEPMRLALACAEASARAGEVPVGAVVTVAGRVVATGENRNRRDQDPTAHAEIVAIRAACSALGEERLTGCDLWVTLEPCAMCAGAIAHARIARLYYGAADPKGGGVEHGARLFAQPQCHHRPELFAGLGEAASADLLRSFFAARR
jgi:tRNA(Arg) A34 adenosine deaminase TadA